MTLREQNHEKHLEILSLGFDVALSLICCVFLVFLSMLVSYLPMTSIQFAEPDAQGGQVFPKP